MPIQVVAPECGHAAIPMKRDEVAALEKMLRDRKLQATDYVFQSEQGERMCRD